MYPLPPSARRVSPLRGSTVSGVYDRAPPSPVSDIDPFSERPSRRLSPDFHGPPINGQHGIHPTSTLSSTGPPPDQPIQRDNPELRGNPVTGTGSTSHQTQTTTGGNTTDEVRVTRLVIGLDFGTTYTGIAYATPLGTVCPLDQITPITDWGEGMKNHEKVPSVISYTIEPRFQNWGSNIGPEAVTMVHKKLELGLQPLQGELDLVVQALESMKDLNFQEILRLNGSNRIPVDTCKHPEEIVTDYLSKVFQYLDQTVDAFTEAYRRYTITDLVVTVPTDWPYEALNSTYRAVSRAGFNRANFPRLNDVMFVTESEAAARYTVRHYREVQQANFLQENSYFVLCDAGGGTVDIVSYKVIKTDPILQLKQIGRPTGAKCGSIFINQKFKKWLRNRIGDQYYRQLDPDLSMDKAAAIATETPAMRLVMEEFDKRKEQFAAQGTVEIPIDLPHPLDNISIPGIVREGVLSISRAQMEDFFDDCLVSIIDMLVEHMAQIERVARGKAKNLFLVGGFGSSKYLKHHLTEALKDFNIQFRAPETLRRDTSWTAVVQGAVVCGIDNAQISTIRRAKACPCSYGVSMDEAFQETVHSRANAIQGRNGEMYAQAQFIWLLNEDDVILANEPRKVTREFDIDFSGDTNAVKLKIYQHSKDPGDNDSDRPERLGNSVDEVSIAATLKIDLQELRRHISSGTRGLFSTRYRPTLSLVLEASWGSLQASIWWESHELARATAPFGAR